MRPPTRLSYFRLRWATGRDGRWHGLREQDHNVEKPRCKCGVAVTGYRHRDNVTVQWWGWDTAAPPLAESCGWLRDRAADPPRDTTMGEVMKRMGWRVEVFWNGGGGFFTARTVNLDHHLVPFEDPIGCSGANPDEAFARLTDAVLEWA